ncbi:MAG: oxidase [Xenococcus sp. (in: cyanobacteria)]
MEIIRDPAQQSGQSSFIGFLSNIGIWLWVSSAAICFFSAMTNSLGIKGSQRELLFLVGLLSMTLAVDDFFLIHDRYINQKLCYLSYAILALSLLVRHYKAIIKIDVFPFLLAGLLLALSILADLTQNYIPLSYSHVQVVEEGFKFIGAAIWLYFSCCIASSCSKPLTRRN